MDGLRCVSIGAVLLYHVGIWPAHIGALDPWSVSGIVARTASNGWVGVQLFFAISGFVLAQPFARAARDGRAAPRLIDYYVRRVARIEPPFVIAILALFLIQWLRRSGDGREPVDFGHLAATLGYVHSWVYGSMSPINTVTWSLEVEVRFYLVAPILFLLLYRVRSAAARRTALAAAACLLAWSENRDETARLEFASSLTAQGPWFLAGILAADVLPRGAEDADAGPRRAWDAAALGACAAFWACLVGWPIPLAAPWDRIALAVILPACAAVFLIAAHRGLAFRSAVSLRWIAVIGGMCYTVYLWHLPLLRVLQGHLPLPPGGFLAEYALHTVVLVAVTLAASAALFLLFEKPFMHRDWPQRAWRALRSRRGGA
ncbi:MAG: O-acetyltransferase OatA [Planctomycetes bacterium]|nr:O-acetyltransferase OatA [Planctomycetota bacterium]